MFRFKLTKHDTYIQELCEQIKDSYDSISTNVLLKGKKRSLAEIDVLAKKGSRVDLFEVKCSYRITKAKKQAKTIRKHFGRKIDHIYFYCGATSTLMLI